MVVQTEQLTAFGVTPDRIYIDRGFSGTSRKNRAGLDQALAAVGNGGRQFADCTQADVDTWAVEQANSNRVNVRAFLQRSAKPRLTRRFELPHPAQRRHRTDARTRPHRPTRQSPHQ